MRSITVALFSGLVLSAPSVGALAIEVVGFDDLPLAPNSFVNGPDPNGVQRPTRFGSLEQAGVLVSEGAAFSNAFDLSFGSWSGFSYANFENGVATGLDRQYVAAPGDGLGEGADNYGIAFGFHDLIDGTDPRGAFDPGNAAHLNALPTIEIPFGRQISSLSITNTELVLSSLANGDSFAKQFGGPTGNDPDWFRVSAYGTDESGTPLGIEVEFLLADFASPNPEEDFVIRDWTEWDLSALAGAARVHFNLSSSDVGQFGLNTPAYFALDNLTLDRTVLPGDYNADGVVNTADYAVWRDTLGDEVDRRGAGADGDLSGLIDGADYLVWRDHLGATRNPTAPVVAVPEPTNIALCLLATAVSCGGARRVPASLLSRSRY